MTTYSADIHPKFRAHDIACMIVHGVRLGDQAWMCDPSSAFGFADHGNARRVFERLSDGSMPTDGPWRKTWLKTYQRWMDRGFSP